MPVAVECPFGHKRAYPDVPTAQPANCPLGACGHLVTIPAPTDDPCYQTARLRASAQAGHTPYSAALDTEARQLFQLVQAELAARALSAALAVEEPGSYSVKAASTDETAAKIVIYEHANPDARELRTFPVLTDGVYVWVRANGDAAGRIWDGTLEAAHQLFFNRLHPAATLGVSRPGGGCWERFTYFRVMPTDPVNDIANLLVDLSQV